MRTRLCFLVVLGAVLVSSAGRPEATDAAMSVNVHLKLTNGVDRLQ